MARENNNDSFVAEYSFSPMDGQITFDGFAFSSALQNKIGYLPKSVAYTQKQITEYCLFCNTRTSESEAKKKAKWLARFELMNYAGKKNLELSKGNQQKVQFICSSAQS